MRPTIAVLPFDDLTDGASGSLLAVGLTEDIITDLSNLSGLNVIAQSSVATFSDQKLSPRLLAEKLGVSYVLRGSIRGPAPYHRVTAQLYDAGTDRQIWGERFDQNLRGVLEFQHEAAVRVVQGMSANLHAGDPELYSTRRFVASEAEALYRQAMDLVNPPNDAARLRIAQQAFERCIELDSEYAGGYAGLAYTSVFTTFWMHSTAPEADLRVAEAAAERALELDPSFGMAYTSLAFVKLIRRDFSAAVELSSNATKIQPNSPYVNIYHAYILAADGQAARGIPYAERAIRLDPLSERTPYLNILGFVSLQAGEYQLSLDAYYRSEERGGPSAGHNVAYHVAANVALGRLDEARKYLQILDSLGDVESRLELPLRKFRHADEAVEKILGRIRELRDADVALADNGV
jgi:adenylate cyclase